MLTVKWQSRSKASCCQESEFTVLLFCRSLLYLDILCELDFNLPCCLKLLHRIQQKWRNVYSTVLCLLLFQICSFLFRFLVFLYTNKKLGLTAQMFQKQCYHTWAISKNSIWWPVLFSGITLLLGLFFRAVSLLNAHSAHNVTKSTWFCQHYQKQLCLCC